MKMIRFIFTGAILLLSINAMQGQTDGGSLIKPFGIGLHIEQFKLSDLNDVNTAPANKLLFSISPSNSFRLEPEIGFRKGKNKTANLKNSSIYAGLGVLGMIQRNKLNIFGGFRVEYAHIKWDDNYSGYSTTITTNTTKRFSMGPVVGCEYFLGENFTFGGELGVKYATLKTAKDPKPSSTNYKDEDSNYFSTDTGLFVRFYF